MSNPLAAFRKHQNVLLAVFGVAIMLSFAVGPIIQGCQQRNGAGPQINPNVVTYRAGAINESELNSMRFARQALNRYMQNIAITAMSRGAQPRGSFIPQRTDDESLVQTKLLADQARAIGMVVDNDEIVRYLNEFTNGTIKPDEFNSLLVDVVGRYMTDRQFFAAMQEHLLAARYGGLVGQGLSPESPAAMWDYYQRLNRRIEAELVEFPASKYVDQVSATVAELTAAYEEGKDRFVDPSSPEPSFKQRKKVAVAYIKCDRDTYLEAEKSSITAADIEAFYETNKESFRNATLPSAKDNESAQESGTDDFLSDLIEESSAEESEAAATESNLESDGETRESETTDSGDQPLEDVDPTGTDCGPQAGDSTEDPTEAVEDPTDEALTSDESNDEASATGDETVSEQLTTAEDGEESADDNASTDDGAVTESTEEPTSSGGVTDADSAAQDADITDLPADPELPEYKPLEEVRETIIQAIAGERAEPKYSQAKDLVESEMRAYFNDYTAWKVNVASDETAPPPPPDLTALAAKHNFTNGSVPLVDPIALTATDPVTRVAKYEIGQAYDGYGQQRIDFVSAVFDESLQKYESRRIPGVVAGTDFIYWKTDEVDPKSPTFEECEDQVERYVKLKKAAELAVAAAKKEADAVLQSGKTLAEYYAGQPNKRVIESGLFSWISVDFQGRLQRGEVPGVEYAGDEFMRGVFSLANGEYGTALNNPRTIAYLVHITTDQTDSEALRLAFARTGPTLDLVQLQRIDSAMRIEQWYRNFEKSQDLTWVRPPRSGR